MRQDVDLDNVDIEIELLLDAINMKYGYDFKGYSRAHIKRRVIRRLSLSGLSSILELAHKVIYDRAYFDNVLLDFSINVTEMFRDPVFYKKFRQEVVPILKTYPFIRVWHAGCATGEEVYSMSILLKEEGLLERAQIYATDFNDVVLQKAKDGIYPIEVIKEYTYNYQQAGGHASFADYYIAKYDSVIMESSLKKKIIFADHNLVTDGVFGEMNVIICRNVMIYFDKILQNKVVNLFHSSLANGGFLCLGIKESLKYIDLKNDFELIADKERIYKKSCYNV